MNKSHYYETVTVSRTTLVKLGLGWVLSSHILQTVQATIWVLNSPRKWNAASREADARCSLLSQLANTFGKLTIYAGERIEYLWIRRRVCLIS